MPVSKKRKKKVENKGKVKEVNYICKNCGEEEKIPYETVRFMDEMDEGDPSYPPMFECERCGGLMTPEKYTSVAGIKFEYKKDSDKAES